jgi:hypothetical protein
VIRLYERKLAGHRLDVRERRTNPEETAAGTRYAERTA